MPAWDFLFLDLGFDWADRELHDKRQLKRPYLGPKFELAGGGFFWGQKP